MQYIRNKILTAALAGFMLVPSLGIGAEDAHTSSVSVTADTLVYEDSRSRHGRQCGSTAAGYAAERR